MIPLATDRFGPTHRACGFPIRRTAPLARGRWLGGRLKLLVKDGGVLAWIDRWDIGVEALVDHLEDFI